MTATMMVNIRRNLTSFFSSATISLAGTTEMVGGVLSTVLAFPERQLAGPQGQHIL